MNRERQRVFVGKLYPGKMWKRKVARMTDAQVMAIFLRERPRLKPPEKKENPMPPSSEPEQIREPRPYPCPECQSTKGYSRMGKFRVQCKNCNALLKNDDVNIQDQEPQ